MQFSKVLHLNLTKKEVVISDSLSLLKTAMILKLKFDFFSDFQCILFFWSEYESLLKTRIWRSLIHNNTHTPWNKFQLRVSVLILATFLIFSPFLFFLLKNWEIRSQFHQPFCAKGKYTTECARDRDLHKFESFGKFVNEKLFCIIYKTLYLALGHHALAGILCLCLNFLRVINSWIVLTKSKKPEKIVVQYFCIWRSRSLAHPVAVSIWRRICQSVSPTKLRPTLIVHITT